MCSSGNKISVIIGLVLVVCGFYFNHAAAQTCPPNIGFEKGNFDGWTATSGRVDTFGNTTLDWVTPGFNTHKLFGPDSALQTDYFGGFPVICPNGSKYSVRLGDTATKARAEGLNYTFTVPAGFDDYSIIYNYAVVFQNPAHSPKQQPKFRARVYDEEKDVYIECSSFEYVSSATLPGFYSSPKGAEYVCKDWTAVTISLKGYAGKKLRLDFVVADCTLGGHFGYVYIDVNEDCGSPISGANICNGDTAITVTGPYGFKEYNWYSEDLTRLIGTGNPLIISPPPPSDTKYALEVIPYTGYGCRDTIFTTVKIVNDIISLVTKDTLEACKIPGADLTAASVIAGSTNGLQYSFHPTLSATTHLADPKHIVAEGPYFIKAVSPNGCKAVKPVYVKLNYMPQLFIQHPPSVVYPATIDLTALGITTGSTNNVVFKYWYDSIMTRPLSNYMNVGATGKFYISATTAKGCTVVKPVIAIVDPPPPYKIIAPNAFSPNGDGINDVFKISIEGAVSISRFSIYNRWGQMMFSDSKVTAVWNGKLNNNLLPIGMYYWVIEGRDIYWNKKVTASGYIVLML